MNRHNLEDWLIEFEVDPAAGMPDGTAQTAPTTDPNAQPQAINDPNVANMNALNNAKSQPPQSQEEQPQQKTAAEQPDVANDPESPQMPEEKPQATDFEVWKSQFIKESVKGDSNRLMELLSQIRNREGLSSYQKKFIEDNWNIQLLRQNSNIEKASKEIRRNLREQLDRNNPATSVVNHLSATLETIPLLNNVFIKLNGYGGLKGDLHRKFLAALTGAVQVGSGANTEDLIFNEREYSILLSTRFNSRWGDVVIGNWSLREDDPERYLSDPEVKRLQEGSPQEKDALRRRIVIESIAELFETRAFIINVVAEDGSIATLGWDIASSLRAAYTQGKLIVKAKVSDNSEAMITDDGKITPLVDLSIVYRKENGKQDEEGQPAFDEFEFIERKDGTLFLRADLKLLKETSAAMQGMSLKELPFTGNPSDLKSLVRCVYSSHDLLMRTC